MNNRTLGFAIAGLVVAFAALGFYFFFTLRMQAPSLAGKASEPQTQDAARGPSPGDSPGQRSTPEPGMEPSAGIVPAAAPSGTAASASASSWNLPSAPNRPSGSGSIRGEVVSAADGGPISGADIRIEYQVWERDAPPSPDAHYWTAKSDAEGTFRVQRLPISKAGFATGRIYVIHARLGGEAASATANVTDDIPNAFTRLELRPAGTISGHVVNKQGEPIPDALVMPESTEERRGSVSGPVGAGFRARTGTDGRFMLDMLPEGRWKLCAFARDYAMQVSSEFHPLGAADVKLVMSKGGTARGSVLSTPGSAPVEGILVKLRGDNTYRNVLTARTDASGVFSVSGVADGKYQVGLDDPTRVAVGSEVSFAMADEQDVAGLKLIVALGGIITGRVYDVDSGEPLAGARISASGPFAREAYADGDGEYRLEGLSSGTYRLRRRWFPGYRHGESREDKSMAVQLGQVLEGVDFPVKKGLSVRGIVVDPSGAPLERVTVQSMDQMGVQEGETTTTREGGTFEHRGFTEGTRFILMARREGFAAEPAGPLTFKNEDIEGVTITMERGGSISGVLVDKSGRGLSGHYVTAMPMQGGSHQGGSTREGGEFKVDGLLPGAYGLRARAENNYQEGKVLQEITLAKGETLEGLRLVFEEAEGLVIAGRITNKNREPVRDAGVNVHKREGEGWGHARSDAEGKFEIFGLPEGVYQVQVHHGEFSTVRDLETEAGNRNLNITVEEHGSVEGHVVLANGRPATEFELTHVQGHHEGIIFGQDSFTTFVDENGYFLLSRVDAGELTIGARAKGHAPTTHLVSLVKPGERTSAGTIRLQAGAAVDGLVVDGAGRPVQGASIYVNHMPRGSMGFGHGGHDMVAAQTDASGQFYLDTLQEGQTTLYASHPDYATASEQVDVRAGAVAQVDIRLSAGGQIEGRITASGAPAAGARVYVHSQGFNGQATSDSSGLYSITGIPSGEVSVVVNLPQPGDASGGGGGRHMNQQASVEEGLVTEVNFDFVVGTAIVEGVVTVDGAPPAQRGSVNISFPELQVHASGQMQPDGAFRIEGLPAGEGTLMVNLHGGGANLTRATPVHTQQGRSIRVDIEMKAGAFLTGTVAVQQEGEMVQVLVLRGAVQVQELSQAFFQQMQSVFAGGTMVEHGAFGPLNLESGEYTLILIALPTAAPSIENARFVAHPLQMQGSDREIHLVGP